ncbi:MAG: GDP-mannose 4,6-dehydratase [Chloroflexi bacterium]|nr:GDP-mannose 4,6-dehydratase [Chloroflexota bacterium]
MNQDGKILLTGATGFIGTHLAKALAEKGKKIRCLVRRSSSEAAIVYLRNLGAELAYGDLSDGDSLRSAAESIETVFHLGGGGRLGMAEDVCYAINVTGTKNLLDACAEQGTCQKFVHISTCGVMGDIKNPPADETYPYNPEPMAYARAKAEAEKLVLSYRDKMPVVAVRFPGVYEQPLVVGELDRVEGVTPMSLIFSTIKRGQWVYIGDGKVLTHWVHVEDVVRGIELAAERGKAGQVYILADDRAVTMQELVELVARLLKVDAPKRHLPVQLAYVLALLFEASARLFGSAPRMTRELVRGFVANRAYNISKARRELGYAPSFNLAEGMQETVRWYEAKGYV